MGGETELRRVALEIPRRRKEWEELLASRGLTPSPQEYVAGLYDTEERLAGCAGLNHGTMQCVAMGTELEGTGLLSRLVEDIRREARERGTENLLVFTKPEYERSFRSLAFRTVGRAERAVLLESAPRGVASYCATLSKLRRPGRNGAIVMNACPMTLGHLHLIARAAEEVDHLYVIPVADDSDTLFDYALRRRILQQSTSGMGNVTVAEGSRYTVSRAVFPSYFIKEKEVLTDTQITLDLDIFSRHLAPALGVTVRYVGEEPTDALTRRYNELMHAMLPEKGIEVREIPRLKAEGEPVSASRVRRLLEERHTAQALRLLPEASRRGVLAELACRALHRELDLTPKPGLVDRHTNGAHRDMDHALMSRGIEALRPWLEALATPLPYRDMVETGIRAEREMLKATGGVNTHKGALFAMGLMLSAAATLCGNGARITAESLGERIGAIAAGFPAPEGTHGGEVRRRYGLQGAIETARSGYARLFAEWLPAYRREHDAARLLLRIMSTLEDTNLYHRGGKEGADHVKARSRELLEKNLPEEALRKALEEFDADLTARNLSPGGGADMLSLTLLADALCEDVQSICENNKSINTLNLFNHG